MHSLIFLILAIAEVLVGRWLLNKLHPHSDAAHAFELVWIIVFLTTLMGVVVHLFQ